MAPSHIPNSGHDSISQYIDAFYMFSLFPSPSLPLSHFSLSLSHSIYLSSLPLSRLILGKWPYNTCTRAQEPRETRGNTEGNLGNTKGSLGSPEGILRVAYGIPRPKGKPRRPREYEGEPRVCRGNTEGTLGRLPQNLSKSLPSWPMSTNLCMKLETFSRFVSPSAPPAAWSGRHLVGKHL